MEENTTDITPLDSSTREFDAVKLSQPKRKTPKSYIFYCVMTLSVMLFTLTFAASELFALFFSDGYPGQMLMTKFFGDGGSGKTLQEIMLGQSFLDLSLNRGETSVIPPPDTTLPTPDTKPTPPETQAPPSDTSAPDSTVTPVDTTTALPSPTPPTEPTDIYAYDPTQIPAGKLGVIPLDLSLSSYGKDYIYDQSDAYDPDLSKIMQINVSTDISSVYPSGAPLVLIVHTHATESYTDEGVTWYDPDTEVGRSKDKKKNVVAVGAYLAERLNELGIPTLHCDILHDETSYSGAYPNSAETVKRYLEKYPSIQYVIDLHRDAIQRSTGEIVRPVAECEDGAAAQLMCVVGSGASTVGGSHWQKNLALAQKLRNELNASTENLCRPTCLRDSAYNQQLSTYSLLLEMGSAGNTLAEAMRTADLVAVSLAKVIKG